MRLFLDIFFLFFSLINIISKRKIYRVGESVPDLNRTRFSFLREDE